MKDMLSALVDLMGSLAFWAVVAFGVLLWVIPVKAEPVGARGLFCDTIEEVRMVLDLADAGKNPQEAIAAVNEATGKTACMLTVALIEIVGESKLRDGFVVVHVVILGFQTPFGMLPVERLEQYMPMRAKEDTAA